MSNQYILNGHTPIPCRDLMQWANWMEKADRHVALDKVDEVKVSTVFLGLDYNFHDGEPLLFETMVFGGSLDQEMDRYPTWDTALAGHAVLLKRVREAQGKIKE